MTPKLLYWPPNYFIGDTPVCKSSDERTQLRIRDRRRNENVTLSET
jgi:hypothetical protein